MSQSISQFGLRAIAADSCCGQLANVLSSKVSFPGNPAYVSTQESYFSLQEAALSPACVIAPGSSQDVAEAVKIISGIPSCQFAIKGQTHAPAAGFANINTGVTIDMTSLDSVAVNGDYTVASVGGGASWLDVYMYLDALGLAVAGGRNGAVGVGGLTLGGGISYFAPRVGWACDNVVNFEIVLASGTLTNVNATSSPDLFRSLKGGGNNFGIVTRFNLATFPQGQILGGNIAQDISRRDEVFRAFANIADAPGYDPYASLVTGVMFNATSKVWGIATTAVYTRPVERPEVYEELLGIPTTTSTLHLTNLSALAAEAAPPTFNWVFCTGTYGVSATLLSKIFDSLNETLYDFNIDKGISWSIAFEPVPTVITQYGDLKGGNSLGTSPKDGNAFVMLVAALWSNSTANDLVEKKAATVIDNVAEIAKTMGLLHRFQYLNYADPSQDPIGSYGPENVENLRETSRKYDPKGVFQRQVPGGFKLELHY
ncbi:FAD binding domain protein [Leptodontidium sp. MPI-SDFR-AT-0119]|nr:FAD binding domain protein [Leptodontidium sp. MPI-SDFR-AT-0119]